MARDEHLAQLSRGVESWNEWVRRQRVQEQVTNRYTGTRHEGTRIGVSSFLADLSGADLSGWDLNQGKPGAYSTGIDLLGVDLRDADLSGTNLAWSELTGATLSGAACREATLNSARFHGANLSGADLSGANIAGTNLQMVNFRGANLTGANLYETVFSDTDLTDVVGLDACQHSGPCTMDHRTLFGYQALPLTFLRGCGLPEPLIAELDELRQALHEDPLRFYSCFISCSNRDREFAERLHADLRYRGIRCWIYFEDLGTGEDQWGAIYTAIKGHDKLLLICSEASVDSGWVEDEVATAFAEGHKRGETVLFLIRIDDTVLETEKAWAARIRNRLHIGDFTQWRDRNAYEKALEHLLGNLRLANIP